MSISNINISSLKTNTYARLALACFLTFIMYEFYIWIKTETTDNAYVESDISLLGSQVDGIVTKIFFKENEKVIAGDIIAEIDDIDYKASLDRAISSVEAAKQSVYVTEQKIAIEKINIDKLTETIAFAKENYEVAGRDYDRTLKLTSDNFSSRKVLDDSKISLERTKLELLQSEFALKSAMENLRLLEAQKLLDQANLSGLESSKEIATRAYDNTRIKAKADGILSNLGVRLGNFVHSGQTIAAIVPGKIYVKANFKEIQVNAFKEGDEAKIRLDGLPSAVIKGKIRSISPASGSKFSLIPTDNATGNFTKVVQRFPVVIDIEVPQDIERLVRVGMSANVSIRKR